MGCQVWCCGWGPLTLVELNILGSILREEIIVVLNYVLIVIKLITFKTLGIIKQDALRSVCVRGFNVDLFPILADYSVKPVYYRWVIITVIAFKVKVLCWPYVSKIQVVSVYISEVGFLIYDIVLSVYVLIKLIRKVFAIKVIIGFAKLFVQIKVSRGKGSLWNFHILLIAFFQISKLFELHILVNIKPITIYNFKAIFIQ